MIMFGTIMSGVFVFVLGQTILKLFVEPWQKQRECIANISNNFLFYANVYANPSVDNNDKVTLVSTETRKLSAELISRCNRIPFYVKLSKTKLFPSVSIINRVHKNLIGLSNSLYADESKLETYRKDNREMVKEIKELLNIHFD